MSWFPLILTLRVATFASLLAIVIGVPLAWLLARRRFFGRDLLSVGILLPMVLPPTVLGYYLLLLLGRPSAIGRFAESIGLGRIIFTPTAAVIAAFVAALPFVVRTAQAGFEQIDPVYEEAARTLGRTEGAIFFAITVPLAWRAIIAGTALGFARAMGEFGATLMIAGNIPGRTQTASIAIYDAVQAYRLSDAHTLAITLSLITGGILLVLTKMGRSGGLVILSVDLKLRVGSFDLAVAFELAGGITALFGPSGSGKTLTLRSIAGLTAPTAGRITLGDTPLFDSARGIVVPARDRSIGYVFQQYALFPHLTVAGNLEFGIHERPEQERKARVASLLQLLGLEDLGERRPRELSGGQQQRVAIGRALATDPALLLLDEPFAAVDFRVRRLLRAELRRIHELTGTPMLLVTHDLGEVRQLSDTLVLMDQGRGILCEPTATALAHPLHPLLKELSDEQQ